MTEGKSILWFVPGRRIGACNHAVDSRITLKSAIDVAVCIESELRSRNNSRDKQGEGAQSWEAAGKSNIPATAETHESPGQRCIDCKGGRDMGITIAMAV